MYRIWVCFCLYGTFVPVTRSFHLFRIRRRLIFELFRNPESTCWTVYLFYFCLNTNPPMFICVPLPCLHMWAETTLGELAISLVLVISFEPVNVEAESRNFSTFEVQPVYRWQLNKHLCSNILAYVHIDYIWTSLFLIDG